MSAPIESKLYDVLRNAYTDVYQGKHDLSVLFSCFELAAVGLACELACPIEQSKALQMWTSDRKPTFGGALNRLNEVLNSTPHESAEFHSGLALEFITCALELQARIQEYSFSNDFVLIGESVRHVLVNSLNLVVQLRNLRIHDSILEVDEMQPILEKLYQMLLKAVRILPPKAGAPLAMNIANKRHYLFSYKPDHLYKGSSLQSEHFDREAPELHAHPAPAIRKPREAHQVMWRQLSFIHIPSGSILLKSYESRVNDEYFISPFYLATTPVTLKDYELFLKDNSAYAVERYSDPLFLKGSRSLRDDKRQYYEESAVYYINWYDAQAYCDWLSTQYGLPPYYKGGRSSGPKGFRLPTEYEWYYAATCGRGKAAVMPKPKEIVNRQNRGKYGKVASNSELHPNEWGLLGMLGNINEWTNSISKRTVLKNFERSKPRNIKRPFRVLISGGSFASALHLIRYDYCTDLDPTHMHYIGFRIAIENIE